MLGHSDLPAARGDRFLTRLRHGRRQNPDFKSFKAIGLLTFGLCPRLERRSVLLLAVLTGHIT